MKRERKKRYVVIYGYPYEKNKIMLRPMQCFKTKKEAKEFRKDLIPIYRYGTVIKAVYCDKGEFEFNCIVEYRCFFK